MAFNFKDWSTNFLFQMTGAFGTAGFIGGIIYLGGFDLPITWASILPPVLIGLAVGFVLSFAASAIFSPQSDASKIQQCLEIVKRILGNESINIPSNAKLDEVQKNLAHQLGDQLNTDCDKPITLVGFTQSDTVRLQEIMQKMQKEQPKTRLKKALKNREEALNNKMENDVMDTLK